MDTELQSGIILQKGDLWVYPSPLGLVFESQWGSRTLSPELAVSLRADMMEPVEAKHGVNVRLHRIEHGALLSIDCAASLDQFALEQEDVAPLLAFIDQVSRVYWNDAAA